ncbi:hypothetical protein CPC08DRAFT_713666 [Agrocybe pediades]|nr:hypothetical protein CPC08DRAFT_713666 [Agrocybe pediades]
MKRATLKRKRAMSKNKRAIKKCANKSLCLPCNISSTDANFSLQQFMTTIHIAFEIIYT